MCNLTNAKIDGSEGIDLNLLPIEGDPTIFTLEKNGDPCELAMDTGRSSYESLGELPRFWIMVTLIHSIWDL